MSFIANWGMTRANETWRTAGRLWIAFVPMGHRRWDKRFEGRRESDCERVEYERVRRAARELPTLEVATFGAALGRPSVGAEDLKVEARREDSSLNVIVASSGVGCK